MTMRSKSAFNLVTTANGSLQLRRFRTHQPTVPNDDLALAEIARQVAMPAATDDFYDRLQRIWDRVFQFEDLGIIHTEFDKFKYAYQLAEAEIQEMCRENAALRQ